MNTIPAFLIVAFLFTISTVEAAPRVGEKPEGICTLDINPWGQASQCFCGEGVVYDSRSGMCLNGGAEEQVRVQGTVKAGVMAIGGETTGFLVETSEGKSFELILKTGDQEKLSKINDARFEIEGELIIIEGIEIKKREVIIAERVTVL